MRIIGLSGRAGVGKDTAAKRLCVRHGFVSRAFAYPLKEAARNIFGFTDAQLNGNLKEVVDEFWGKTPRKVMQLLGTDCVRKIIDDDVWIKSMERAIKNPRDLEGTGAINQGAGIAITDVRFPNEAHAIRRWGGEVWRIERPIAAVEAHVSETALDAFVFDRVLKNPTGTIEALWALVDECMDTGSRGAR